MNFTQKIVLCLGIVIASHCNAMEKSLRALHNGSGETVGKQEEVQRLEASSSLTSICSRIPASISSCRNCSTCLARVVCRFFQILCRPLVNFLTVRPNNLVSIIDSNEGQSLEELMGPEPGIIGVFGGTPRYSFFENYRQTLTECTSELLKQCDERVKRAKPKCLNPLRHLKGVERRIRKLLIVLREDPGLQAFRDGLSTFSEEEMMNLFFAAGFDHELFAKNIGTLLDVAQQSLRDCSSAQRSMCLVHVFMPSYFSDLAHIRSMPDVQQKLHLFLTCAAFHYQRLYEQAAAHPDLKICILIPPIEYFMEAMRSDGDEKASTNSTVVLKEIVERVNPKAQCILFDQGRNRQAMVSLLQTAGRENVSGTTIPLTSLSGLAIHTFNPYLLIPKKNKDDGSKKKHDYKTSPLFNLYLVKFFQQRHEGSSHE